MLICQEPVHGQNGILPLQIAEAASSRLHQADLSLAYLICERYYILALFIKVVAILVRDKTL